MVKTEEIQIKPPPEQEEPTVTEQENLPQEIVIDKGNFSRHKLTHYINFLLYSAQTLLEDFYFCLLPLPLVIHICAMKICLLFYRGSVGENRRDKD